MIARWTIAGDSNLDNTVDTTDFMLLAQNFGSSTADFAQGDINYDGVVNALDFNAIATNFGGHASPAASPALPLAAVTALSANLFSAHPVPTDRLVDLIDAYAPAA
jgi:hypothetical protein